jgi:hypothetical protein
MRANRRNTTSLKFYGIRDKLANDIISINDSVKKDIQWLAVGVSQFDKVKYLSKNLSKVNIIASKIRLAAKSRRILTKKGEKHIPELTQYDAFMHNYYFLKKAWEKGNEMR